jgi:predicted 2-oxoglutarate/Fe(II)-dependent dioxygenase YbiX
MPQVSGQSCGQTARTVKLRGAFILELQEEDCKCRSSCRLFYGGLAHLSAAAAPHTVDAPRFMGYRVHKEYKSNEDRATPNIGACPFVFIRVIRVIRGSFI